MINETKLSLEQIHEKIMDDTFAELTVFPQYPNLDLCLEYGDTLLDIALSTFPQIHKHLPYPDIFAILMVLLLYSTDIDLYNECATMEDIMDKLNSDKIMYGSSNKYECRLEDKIKQKRHCACSHDIKTVYMCNANTNFFVLGCDCINKTKIVSLIDQYKKLQKRNCEICGDFRKPANQNIDICVPCSKKIYCNYCNDHKPPSKQNPELCTKCSKECKKCQNKPCNRYTINYPIYCDVCLIVKKAEQDEERKQRKQLEELEKNKKNIKCETCPEIMLDPPHWKKQCLSCYKQKQTYIEERQKINEQKKQEALKLQKEISDLNK
jgi:hypothetical protein